MKTPAFLSFHSSQEIKDKYLNRLKEHRRLEQLIQGIGYETGSQGPKGCAVGCTIDKYDHKAYETELGLPEWLARLEDHLFDHLSKEKAEQFAVDFLEAIPVGKDINPVCHKLAILRQEASLDRLQTNKEPYADESRNAIQLVIAWHNSILKNDAPESVDSAADSARAAAWSAADSARVAAWSAAADLADSAWSAADSARAAAWSAADLADSAWSAARAADSAWAAGAAGADYYEWEASTLIQLLKEA